MGHMVLCTDAGDMPARKVERCKMPGVCLSTQEQSHMIVPPAENPECCHQRIAHHVCLYLCCVRRRPPLALCLMSGPRFCQTLSMLAVAIRKGQGPGQSRRLWRLVNSLQSRSEGVLLDGAAALPQAAAANARSKADAGSLRCTAVLFTYRACCRPAGGCLFVQQPAVSEWDMQARVELCWLAASKANHSVVG